MEDKIEIICPICGKTVFEKMNSFEICPVCKWENDAVQFCDPEYALGANGISLNEYKRKYESSLL